MAKGRRRLRPWLGNQRVEAGDKETESSPRSRHQLQELELRDEGNNLYKRAGAFLMQFRKWPHYLRERKPRHLRVDGRSGLETPPGCMALMQTTSPQGEQGALGPESPLGRITHAAIQTETHLPYQHPGHDQWIRPRSKRGATTSEESKSGPPIPRGVDACLSREKYGADHHFSLARLLMKERYSRLDGRKLARTSSRTLPPKNHTQDLRLFHCELSKVA